MMECLLAQIKAPLKANHEEFMAAIKERFEAQMDAWLERIKDCRGATEVCLDRKEPTSEMAIVAAHPEDSKGTTRKERFRANEDRSREHERAVRSWISLKR
jgi:hypothetical protein